MSVHKERPTKYKGYVVVHATHPNMAKFDDRSRGRKRHLIKEPIKGGKTLCNMLFDGWIFTEYLDYNGDWYDAWINNGICKSCLKGIKI